MFTNFKLKWHHIHLCVVKHIPGKIKLHSVAACLNVQWVFTYTWFEKSKIIKIGEPHISITQNGVQASSYYINVTMR